MSTLPCLPCPPQPPELLEGGELGKATDVYSFGVLLWEVRRAGTGTGWGALLCARLAGSWVLCVGFRELTLYLAPLCGVEAEQLGQGLLLQLRQLLLLPLRLRGVEGELLLLLLLRLLLLCVGWKDSCCCCCD